MPDAKKEIEAAFHLEPEPAMCGDCGLLGGLHNQNCYHADCDEDDMEVHGCGPKKD